MLSRPIDLIQISFASQQSRNLMDLRQLEYVVAVSDELSFTRAAERCHVAQSALSHQIAQLEEELGQRLFERTSRSVRRTEAGEALAASARRILASVLEARADLDALAGQTTGRLAIGATQTAGRALDLVALFGAYRRRYPEVSLSVLTGPMAELSEAVELGDLDLALGDAQALRTSHLDVETLVRDERLVAILPDDHPLADRRSLTLPQLSASGPLTEFRPGAGPRTKIDALFRKAKARREIAFELGQLSDMVAFAAHGLGPAIVPASFARDAQANLPPFIAIPLRPTARVSVDAAWRRDAGSQPLGAFLDLARNSRGSAG